MACSFAAPISHYIAHNNYSCEPFTYHSTPFIVMDNQSSSRALLGSHPNHATSLRPQSIPLNSDNYVFPSGGWSARSPTTPRSPHSFPQARQSQHDNSAWSPQPQYRRSTISTHSFNVHSSSAPRVNSNAQLPHTKSHSRSYSDVQQHQRRSSQPHQGYFPLAQLPYNTLNGRTPSPVTNSRHSSSSTSSLSPPQSPLPFADALAPVHPIYEGLPRTDSGLIPIPQGHRFARGEIVMTRTTRRLMKTSSTGRLTARHPCLILESTTTHVRVLQMTSHVHLTSDQVRAVGAKLQHWLARDDTEHRDLFGRRGLETNPPSNRAGYIWVGDGGEWVPLEHVKYLTGTIVEEAEMQRLESLAEHHSEY